MLVLFELVLDRNYVEDCLEREKFIDDESLILQYKHLSEIFLTGINFKELLISYFEPGA